MEYCSCANCSYYQPSKADETVGRCGIDYGLKNSTRANSYCHRWFTDEYRHLKQFDTESVEGGN